MHISPYTPKKDAMKTQITLPLICFAATLVMACTSDPKPAKETNVVDRTTTKDTTASAVFSEADENKVIGNINFGIDSTQFKNEHKAFIATLDHNEFQTIHAIGGYLFSKLSGKFDLNKLAEVSTTGDLIAHERYNAELLPQVDILKELIIKKYGEPHSGTGAPDYKVLKKDQATTAYSWTIGSKVINIDITNRGDYNSCDLKIFKK